MGVRPLGLLSPTQCLLDWGRKKKKNQEIAGATSVGFLGRVGLEFDSRLHYPRPHPCVDGLFRLAPLPLRAVLLLSQCKQYRD